MNETEIIKGCLKNERASQKALFEHYYGKVAGVCTRYSNTPDEAKAMLHEGFLKVFSSIKNYNNKGSFEKWMRNIIVNNTITHLHNNKHNYLIVSTVRASEKEPVAAEKMSDDELLAHINDDVILKAMQALAPAYRTVFNLFMIEEYNHKEIAELLDISEDTSKSNLQKAKFNLRKNLMQQIKVVNGK